MADKAKFLLRDYQKEIVFRVHEAWKWHRSVMVQMPTGTGKTHVLAEVVNGFLGTDDTDKSVTKRILIVAHRIELIGQIRETLSRFHYSLPSLTEGQGGGSAVSVESIQTISRRIESLDFTPDLVIIDEAHHALAKTYRVLWEKWPKAKFLGLTATPCRMNRSGFTDLFDVLVTSWSIAEFIAKGVLSAFDYASIRPDCAEQQLIDALEKRGADGDYQVKEMDAVLNKRPSIERLYRSMMQFAKGKKGIVYAISIDHARNIASYYKEQGVNSVAIDSKTPREERKQLVNDFKEGKIQVLVNVDVFSEGFDCPDVEFVQMARPTLSLSKYLQQVGRGLRKSAGKESCMMIDNVGLYRVFGLPVVNRNWEAMFCGKETGKGTTTVACGLPTAGKWCCADNGKEEAVGDDIGVGLVVSHEMLLAQLGELEQPPITMRQTATLKAWQDEERGLWGLRRGRNKVTEAEYVSVFDLKEGVAAVRFQNHACGLVDDTGRVLWKRGSCISMRFTQNRFLVIGLEGGRENYVDLCNLNVYSSKPRIRQYGKFELLEADGKCYTRTEEVYVSEVDFSGLIIFCKGHLLCIHESADNTYCMLEGDSTECYRVHHWLTDGGMLVSDRKGKLYLVTKEGGKRVMPKAEGCINVSGSMQTEARGGQNG
ncbi:MAG: DEAD/DEAH box helicase [Bacteroides sp.]|nr:DEAD/DEAH box helicase [Bacteroides sp.]